MRTKKWEKWYWGIVFTIIVGLTIRLILKEKGFEFTNKKTGETKEWSKIKSFFIVILPSIIGFLWIWFCLRFFLLKTNDFICKYCRKEFGRSFETEKNVCKTCYEKQRN